MALHPEVSSEPFGGLNLLAMSLAVVEGKCEDVKALILRNCQSCC
jgi:hypothetical protein